MKKDWKRRQWKYEMIDNKKKTLPPDADVICTPHTGTKKVRMFLIEFRILSQAVMQILSALITQCEFIVTHDESGWAPVWFN